MSKLRIKQLNNSDASSGQVVTFTGDNNQWQYVGTIRHQISQNGHSFVEGDVVYFDGSEYALAQAIPGTPQSNAIGIVDTVVDTNTFVITTQGFIDLTAASPGFNDGSVYYLDPTVPGQLTTTISSTAGDINKPMLIAVSDNTGYVINYPATTNQVIDDLFDVDTTTNVPQTGEYLTYDGNNWIPGVISGLPVVAVNQPGHSFGQGDAVYLDSADDTWKLALSDDDTTAGVGLVDIVDINNFNVIFSGTISGLSSLSPGEFYFVSATVPGALDLTEPDFPNVSNPILHAVSATDGVVMPYRPSIDTEALIQISNTLDGLSDVIISSPAEDDILVYNGTEWTNEPSNFQTLDSDLTALANTSTTGIYIITGSGTSATRTLTGTANEIEISNGDGVSGNPTIGLPNDVTISNNLTVSNNIIVTGTVDGRDISADGSTLDALDSLSSTVLVDGDFTTNGIMVRTAVNTYNNRSITGTANQITVSNGDGVSGNPSISLVNNPTIPGTGSITIPVGTTAQRPSGTAGEIRYNSTENVVEFYDAGESEWKEVGSSSEKFIYTAANFENPVNSDWAVDNLAPAIVDPANNALIVRAFDDTTEEGIGFWLTVPSGTSEVNFRFVHRRQTGTGSQNVVVRFWEREIPNNTGITTWSGTPQEQTLSVPNTNYQYDDVSFTFATLGLTAGSVHQFEITRQGTDASDNLSGDWLLLLLEVTFT